MDRPRVLPDPEPCWCLGPWLLGALVGFASGLVLGAFLWWRS